MAELADVLVGLGAHSGMNLDGGGSASLVCHGELVNTPREQHGIELAGRATDRDRAGPLRRRLSASPGRAEGWVLRAVIRRTSC